MRRAPGVACTSPPTAGARGITCSTRAWTSAPSKSSSPRPIHRRYMPDCGTRDAHRGSPMRRRTDRAEASTSPRMAAPRGCKLTNGLPPEGIGRTGIAVAPSNPQRVYAVVDCLVPDPSAPRLHRQHRCARVAAPGQGGVFRSDDGGSSWTKMSGDTALWAVVGTSRRSPSIRATRISSTCQTLP